MKPRALHGAYFWTPTGPEPSAEEGGPHDERCHEYPGARGLTGRGPEEGRCGEPKSRCTGPGSLDTNVPSLSDRRGPAIRLQPRLIDVSASGGREGASERLAEPRSRFGWGPWSRAIMPPPVLSATTGRPRVACGDRDAR